MSGYAVHLDSHTDAVPVDRARLRQMICEVRDQAIAHVETNKRTWNAAVVSPRLDLASRLQRHSCNLRLDVDFDDVRIGIDVDRISQLDLRIPARRLKRLSSAPCSDQRDQNQWHQDAHGECSYLQISVMQIDSNVRFGAGTASPRSVINFRSRAAVSGCATADCTPTRTRPSA